MFGQTQIKPYCSVRSVTAGVYKIKTALNIKQNKASAE